MNKYKVPNFITILILTLITIVIWVGFEVYGNLTKSEEVIVSDEIIEPLVPTLDEEALENVNQRLFFEESEIRDALTTITPEATEDVVLTEEIVEEPTESTESAGIQ